jgi:ribonuclease P protein component
MPGFVLLVRERDDGIPNAARHYRTKKIGGAVVRNRMKRRFRALAREVLPSSGITGADHVLIGRAGGVERNYAALEAELRRALKKLRSSGMRPVSGIHPVPVRAELVEALPFSGEAEAQGRPSTSSGRAEVMENCERSARRADPEGTRR